MPLWLDEHLRLPASAEHVEVALIGHHELVAHVAGAAREQQTLLGVEHLRIAIP